ncbi:MAG TPA: hypothetical protein V6C81_11520 [Planktothrix sp.]|jgi:hypothetical protein
MFYLLALGLFLLGFVALVKRPAIGLGSVILGFAVYVFAIGRDVHRELTSRPAWMNWVSFVCAAVILVGYVAYKKAGYRKIFGASLILCSLSGIAIGLLGPYGLFEKVVGVLIDLYFAAYGLTFFAPAKKAIDAAGENASTTEPAATNSAASKTESDAASKTGEDTPKQ